MHEPPITEQEARAEGFELDDYETSDVGVWPDNRAAFFVFAKVGTRWRYPSMGGSPIGFDWPAIYPLMDRQDADWDDLHEGLIAMEYEAINTMREFAPKGD